MNTARRFGVLAALITSAVAAHAGDGLTREQVRQEYIQARANGDVVVNYATGLTAREATPFAYPPRPLVAGRTRDEVIAELREAERNGDMLVGNGFTAYERNPSAYPARPQAVGKSREEVRAELAEAVRTGDIVAAGEMGSTTLRELYPSLYRASNERQDTLFTGVRKPVH
jgi:hypothetical protein